jgi:hypothetical protein
VFNVLEHRPEYNVKQITADWHGWKIVDPDVEFI